MKKVLLIIIGIIVGTIIIVAAAFGIVSLTSKKMSCTSSRGDITLMYNDDKITGYLANDLEYDLDGQQAYSEAVGIDSYLREFSDWFETETNGTCTKD